MRVLHLFGDWKWTGPAEPTLDLCQELRALGVEADLACMEAPLQTPRTGTRAESLITNCPGLDSWEWGRRDHEYGKDVESWTSRSGRRRLR